MALLSNMDPDPTPPSTLCCNSTVRAYKHSDLEKKGKERREIKDRTRSSVKKERELHRATDEGRAFHRGITEQKKEDK